jgi:hypothetical protein
MSLKTDIESCKIVNQQHGVVPVVSSEFVGLLGRLQVKWQNWKVRKTGRAYRHLSKAMQDDPGYALTWQCNIAMPIYDGANGKLTLPEANAIADRLMKHLFNVKQPNAPHERPATRDNQ